MNAPAIDLSRNDRQAEFFNAVMLAVAGKSSNRYFGYGGGIRGGKTYVCLFIFILLAKKYPGSRWHVVRKDLPVLKSTTIPSFEKLMPSGCRIIRDPGNMHCEFPNGSRIYFRPESISDDPELNKFLGLETNGLVLEQAEELDEKTFERAKERTGSWYIDPMPPALILLSCNPTDDWFRKEFYDPYVEGTLSSPFYYQEALAEHNPFVTQDQWNTWAQLDPISFQKMVKGDWDVKRTNNTFYFNFAKERHVRPIEINPALPVHLSFDQNVLPYITMTCYQVEYNNGLAYLREFDEICLPDPRNTTGELCQEFLSRYPDVRAAFLYGDASGNRRNTLTKNTDYGVAKTVLRAILTNTSDRTLRVNPPVSERREWIANVMADRTGIRFVVDPKCSLSIADLAKTPVDANGHKLKKKIKGPNGEYFEPYGHTSDTLDYVLTTIFKQEFQSFCNNQFGVNISLM